MTAAGRRRIATTLATGLVAIGLAAVAGISPVRAGQETHSPSGAADDRDARAASGSPEVRWYLLSLDERPCGRTRRARSEGPDQLRVVEDTVMAVARGGTEVRMAIHLETVEAGAGRLREVSRRFDAGAGPSSTRWVFEDDAVEEIRIEAGRRSTRTIEPPTDRPFLSPDAAAAFFAARRAAGAATATWTTVAFEQGFEIVEVVATRLGETTFEWEGRPVPVERWRLDSTGTPLPVEERWSPDGRLVESRVATGLGELVARLATAEEAAAWRGAALPDVVEASVVMLDGRLPADEAEVRLRIGTRGDAALPVLPATPRQRYERMPAADGDAAETGRLTVRRRGPDFEGPAEATPGPEFLANGPLLETDDERVRQLALDESGIDPEAVPADRAERLRRFVRSWIRRKDLATALAGAAEVARTRRGDCTEHATLLAALLRVHGIPSRIAVGLVHAERFAGRRNVFAWHAWAQGWIDGRWVDLDATAARRGEGVRIAVAFSDLAGGAFDPVWSAALPVMGAIELEVLGDAAPAPDSHPRPEVRP